MRSRSLPLSFAATALVGAVVAALGPASVADARSSSGHPIRASVAATPDPGGDVQVRGSGRGHGVGLSQYGARAMAADGRSHTQILAHYFPGTSLGSRATTDPTQAAGAPISVGLVTGVTSVPVTAEGNVPWRRCTSGGCSDVATQANGQTFTVQPRSDGGFTIRRSTGTDLTVAGGSGVWLVADHDGTVVRGPNPNRSDGRARYRHGRMEFEVRPASSSPRLVVAQRVPNVELYLRGLAEMPTGWGSAALRSQAVVGRNYALRQLSSGMRTACRCHVLATPADQAYQGFEQESAAPGWVTAVDDTAGQVVVHGTQLAQTFYASSHGGRSENVEDSWAYGSTPIPYLRSVDDPWSVSQAAGNPHASWSATLTATQLRPLVSNQLRSISRVQVLDRTAGGTPRTLRFTGSDGAGNTVRIDWPSGGKPAGARMRAHFGSSLFPSQQLTHVEVRSTVPFSDVGGSGHETAIRWAHDAAITTGVTSTRFEPGQAVTREQMASFIARTFELPSGSVSGFRDVAAGSTHAAAIGSLAAAGITQGCTADRFCPRDPVTREQMASFLARALGLRLSGSSPFRDVPSGSSHGSAIAALASSGITAGCTADRFCPRDPVTRAQMATFLYRTVRSR